MIKLLLSKTFVFILVLSFSITSLFAQISFSTQSNFKYLKGNSAGSLASNWMDKGFNDLSWTSGNAPFRYGDGTGGTDLTDMRNNYSTLYLRTTFTASQVEFLGNITFTINYDDGFVLWINGVEAVRSNAPAVLSNTGLAPDGTTHEFNISEIFTVSTSALNLIDGVNTIAIQCFNTSLTASSDFFFDIAMSAGPEISDTIDIGFSSVSGFKNSPFSLNITSPDPAAHVVYTLDGSNPQNSSSAIVAGVTAIVTIDPSSSAGRGTTPAVVVRASLARDGFNTSKPQSRTYIFIESVKTQAYPGGDWPNYDVNGQRLDYPMDANVVNDSRYTDQIDDALLDLPSISIITDNKNLFDPSTGIYVNPLNHGANWERECSVELINPDGSEGFGVNAGLRIRGGYSRNTFNPKHAFRLFFREEYGDAKLYFPLFGDEGVDEFDKIDLRCEQNYAWSQGDYRNTLMREIFSRDTQRDMGQPYTRSRYYHLYLNGLYYGIYQSQERSESRYAADYFGGDAADYDVVKVSTELGYVVEATDGTLDNWRKVYDALNTDLSDNANYYKLEGKDANGKRINGAEVMIDIDNLIDYTLLYFYTGNFDAPVSTFLQNKSPNNFYVIDDRKDLYSGFKFFAHDGEHTLFSEPADPGIGLYENRVNLGTISTGLKMEVNSFEKFHPQWLHFKLSQNAEYRMRFADRAYKHLQADGALTPAKCLDRLNKRAAEVEMAIIAESARWGDISGWAIFTKDDFWIPEVNLIRNNLFPYRTNILISQLRNEDLYTQLTPPIVKKSGNPLNVSKYVVKAPFNAVIENPNSSGILYYTLDGSDPRVEGNSVSGKAISATDNVTINISSSTILKARTYSDGEWSALKHIDFITAIEDYSNLKVTEISYHPEDLIIGTDTTFGKDLEFIEFKNTGESAINLSGLVLDSAIYYEFPNDILLGPKQFWVVVSKPSRFFEFYSKEASGNFSGNLGNSGDEILLKDASENTIIHFTYDDASPWPDAPDGDGYTLVSTFFNPTADPGESTYWRTSLKLKGSPFRDDDGTVDIKSTEMLSDINMMVYPNPAKEFVKVGIKGLNDLEQIGIKIYSVNGSLVYQSEISNNGSIDLKAIGIQAGLYFIQVETSKSVETAKLIFTE